MIQIKVLTNVNSIERNENKDEHNWTLTNEWSDFVKREIKEEKQTMLQTNHKKQLKYVHCQIIQNEELLNEQIKKKISWDKFT